MGRYSYYNDYYSYESVAEKKAKAKKKIEQLRKTNPDIKPVEISGRTIAKTWWGKAWNKNLEAYADFSNRLSRGKSYVTHGCVVDLQIAKGIITATVIGSGRNVYNCKINIDPLSKKKWENIKELVSGKIESLTELLAGKFPKELDSALSAKENGLFPAPKEFHPKCDCPDSARFCKHLAAAIYGIGNRLDAQPELLFSLRGVDSKELIAEAVTEHKNNLIKKAEKVKSKRRMNLNDKKLSGLFGIKFSIPK